MKRKIFVSVLSALTFMSIIFSGCNTEVEIESDTTAPAAVTELKAEAGEGKITLTWKDPADSDLYGIKIYNAVEETARAVSLDDGILVGKGIEKYEISNLENGKSYTFKVSAVDNSFNESEVVTSKKVTFSLKTVEVETEVIETVEKYVYKDGTETVEVHKKNNLYVCPVCQKKYSTIKQAVNCCGPQAVEVEKITYVLILSEGTYNIEHVLQNTDGEDSYTSYTVSTTETDVEVANGSKIDDLKDSYPGFTAKTMALNGNTIYIFYDRNTVTLNFYTEDNTETPIATLQGLYGTTVNYPTLSTDREGYHFESWKDKDGEAVANFPSEYPAENTDYFAVYHEIKTYTITYVTDKGTAPAAKTVICEQEISSTEKPVLENAAVEGTTYYFLGWYLDAAYETKLSGTLTANVNAYAKWTDTIIGTKGIPNAVGDIVFTDGSACSTDDTLTDAQIAAAVAVIFYAGTEEDGLGAKTLGVGINLNDNNILPWAKSGTIGASTLFEDIKATSSSVSSFYIDSSTYGGDLYGKDNWDYICSVDPEGTSDPATNYPVYNWALNYATTYSLTGAFAADWWLPSFPELVELKRNVTTVNSSLSKVVSTVFASGHWYWSSSNYTSSDYVYELNMIDRTNLAIGKTYTCSDQMSICVIREF